MKIVLSLAVILFTAVFFSNCSPSNAPGESATALNDTP
jgi:hypothetical protein